MNDFLTNLIHLVPDKLYISMVYYRNLHKLPNLRNPQTFTEKLQWNKLYNRNPLFTMLVDKIRVKDYITDTIGEQYVIPTLKVWSNVEDIVLDELPDKFILKCNHDSHSRVLCTDKQTFNLEEARRFLKAHLHNNAFWYGREWPYKNVKPCVFAETLLESKDGDLKDYKVLCFNGKAKLIMVNANRFIGDLEEVIYDLDWNKTDITQGYPSSKEFEKPSRFDEMIHLSEVLSKGINHVRVDWYNFEGKLYFGEMTFFDGSGFVAFDNPDHDLLLGSWISLGEKNE